jgi:UDP-3-O-acyl N-acetylglucosamine deacetylase
MSWTDPCQGTLAREVSFSGVGIHTGQAGTVTLSPAPAGRGRVFLTPSGVEVPARLDFVLSTDRSTILGRDGVRVSTPEHLLSALYAAGIDNVEIAIDCEEVPILDGSALPYWHGLQEAGRESQGVAARTLILDKPVGVGAPDGPMVMAWPSPHPVFENVLYYPHPLLGTQTVVFAPDDDFGASIAPARTFALWEEVQALLDRGMALGGSLENALLVHHDHFSSPLRLAEEPSRHKCLDLIGDFALLDARLQARVLAVRAGHRWHVEAARKLWESLEGHAR